MSAHRERHRERERQRERERDDEEREFSEQIKEQMRERERRWKTCNNKLLLLGFDQELNPLRKLKNPVTPMDSVLPGYSNPICC